MTSRWTLTSRFLLGVAVGFAMGLAAGLALGRGSGFIVWGLLLLGTIGACSVGAGVAAGAAIDSLLDRRSAGVAGAGVLSGAVAWLLLHSTSSIWLAVPSLLAATAAAVVTAFTAGRRARTAG